MRNTFDKNESPLDSNTTHIADQQKNTQPKIIKKKKSTFKTVKINPDPNDSSKNTGNHENKTSAYEAYAEGINNTDWPFRETAFFKQNKDKISKSLVIEEISDSHGKHFVVSKKEATNVYDATIVHYKDLFKNLKIQNFIEILNQDIEVIYQDLSLSQLFAKKIARPESNTTQQIPSIEAIEDPIERKGALESLHSTLNAIENINPKVINEAKTCYENLLELKALSKLFPESAENVHDPRIYLEALLYCLVMAQHYSEQSSNRKDSIKIFSEITEATRREKTALDKELNKQNNDLLNKIQQTATDLVLLEELQTSVPSITKSELGNTDLGDMLSANASLEFIKLKKETLKKIIAGAELTNTAETLPSLSKQIDELSHDLITAKNNITKVLSENDNQDPCKLNKYKIKQTEIERELQNLATDVDASYEAIFDEKPNAEDKSFSGVEDRITVISNKRTEIKENINRLDSEIQIQKNKINTFRSITHEKLPAKLDSLTTSALAKIKKECRWTFRFAEFFGICDDSTFKDAAINPDKMEKLQQLYNGETRSARILRWMAGAAGDATQAWDQALNLAITAQTIKQKVDVSPLPDSIPNQFEKQDFAAIQDFTQGGELTIRTQIACTESLIKEFNDANKNDTERLASLKTGKEKYDTQKEHLDKAESYITRLKKIKTSMNDLNTAQQNYKIAFNKIDEIFKQTHTQKPTKLISELKPTQSQSLTNRSNAQNPKKTSSTTPEETKKLFRQLGALALHLSYEKSNSANQQPSSIVEQLKKSAISTFWGAAPQYGKNQTFTTIRKNLNTRSVSTLSDKNDDLFVRCGKAIFKITAKRYSDSEILDTIKDIYKNYPDDIEKQVFQNRNSEPTSNENFNSANDINNFLINFDLEKTTGHIVIVVPDHENNCTPDDSKPEAERESFLLPVSSFFSNPKQEEAPTTQAQPATSPKNPMSQNFFSNWKKNIEYGLKLPFSKRPESTTNTFNNSK